GTAPAAFDAYAVLLEFDSDVEFIRRLASLLSTTLPGYMADLLMAAHAGDAPRVAAAAHALRGSVGNIYADRLAGLAGVIERTTRQGRPLDPSLIDELEEAVGNLLSEFVLWAETLEGHEHAVRDSR
ncbi:MAG: Hpt domain-containing protein, partial [Vicinamibacterales bacterium]